MKKKIMSSIALLLVMSMQAQAAEAIKVNINGNALDGEAKIVEGRTLVPLRSIFEKLGADVEWNSAEKSITAVKDNATIKMSINKNSFTVNDEEKTLDVAPMIIDDKTYVPARAVSESFGCDVKWNAEKKTVDINDEISGKNETETATEVTTTAVESTTEATTEAAAESKLSYNGIYFVGEDIQPGEYEFRKADGCSFAFVRGEIFSDSDMSILKKFDNDLNNGIVIYKQKKIDIKPLSYYPSDNVKIAVQIVNCDIYKNGKLVVKHKDKSIKDKINMDINNVSSSVKQRVQNDIETITSKNYLRASDSIEAKTNIRYYTFKWGKLAKTPEDEKYIELYRNAALLYSRYMTLNKEESYMNSAIRDDIENVANGLNNSVKKLSKAISFDDLYQGILDLEQYDIKVYGSDREDSRKLIYGVRETKTLGYLEAELQNIAALQGERSDYYREDETIDDEFEYLVWIAPEWK